MIDLCSRGRMFALLVWISSWSVLEVLNLVYIRTIPSPSFLKKKKESLPCLFYSEMGNTTTISW